ncbi:MAG: hypothetical protein L0Y72_11115 [Gemmataceae bacterium]|nr:hypothetical protein [Gemmataceae bacterium]MCI0739586.1 hypothetical protein [Gemmataceae bacterium]
MTRLYWLMLLLASSLGCTLFGAPKPAPLSWTRLRPAAPPDQAIVQLQLCVIERSIGDPYLNTELWQHTDEMIVDLGRKAALEDNGLRVGQIVGMTPDKLEKLLQSKRACFDKKNRVVTAGQVVTQPLGVVEPAASYTLTRGKEKTPVTLKQARFCMDVMPTLTADGKTRLVFTPKVEHSEARLPFLPDPANSTWTLRTERPSNTYPELSFEVTLAPNEFLVLGGVLDKADSLGRRAFVSEQAEAPLQRVLVLSTDRSGGNNEPTPQDLAYTHPSPSLAAQATFSIVRADRP